MIYKTSQERKEAGGGKTHDAEEVTWRDAGCVSKMTVEMKGSSVRVFVCTVCAQETPGRQCIASGKRNMALMLWLGCNVAAGRALPATVVLLFACWSFWPSPTTGGAVQRSSSMESRSMTSSSSSSSSSSSGSHAGSSFIYIIYKDADLVNACEGESVQISVSGGMMHVSSVRYGSLHVRTDHNFVVFNNNLLNRLAERAINEDDERMLQERRSGSKQQTMSSGAGRHGMQQSMGQSMEQEWSSGMQSLSSSFMPTLAPMQPMTGMQSMQPMKSMMTMSFGRR